MRAITILAILVFVLPNLSFADDNKLMLNNLGKEVFSNSELISAKMNVIIVENNDGRFIKLIRNTNNYYKLPEEWDNIIIAKAIENSLRQDSEILLSKYDEQSGSANQVKPQFLPALFWVGTFVGGSIVYLLSDRSQATPSNNITVNGDIYVAENGRLVIGSVDESTDPIELSYKGATISIPIENNSVNSMSPIPRNFNLSEHNVTSSLVPKVFSPQL